MAQCAFSQKDNNRELLSFWETHVVPSLSEINCTIGLYYRLSYNCPIDCPIGCSTGCSISPWPAAPTGPGAESRYFLKGFWMEKRYLSQSRPLPAACVDRPRILKSILFKRILNTSDTCGTTPGLLGQPLDQPVDQFLEGPIGQSIGQL